MKKIFAVLSFFVSFNLFAQNDTASFKPYFTGSADVYYRYNFNAPEGSQNNYTKFTNTQNTFALGMASLKAVDSFGKASAVVKLGFGQRANEYNYTDEGNLLVTAIKEAYMSYALTNNLKLTAGKWYKQIGYEVPDANTNRNYSMSYSFSFGPMSFTGFKAEVMLAKKVTIMAGIANPADISNVSSSPVKTFIAGVNYNAINNKLKIKLNYQGYSGVSNIYLLTQGYYIYKSLHQYDAVLQYAFNNKLDIVYNGTIQYINNGVAKKWISNIVYVTYKFKPGFDITMRAEYLNDDDALKIGANIFAATVSGNYTINNRLRFIPEIRLDNSPQHIFQKGSTAGTGTTFTGLLAAVYTIGK